MKEFQKRRKIRRIMFSPATLTLLALVFVFLAVSAAGVYKKSQTASSKNSEISAKIEQLKKRKSELENELNRLKSGFGQEEELRKKFNLQKPGEKVLIIVDKDAKSEKNSSNAEEESFLSRTWRAIKSAF